ncbi:MAG: hypothetical protein M1829_000229 [Trizodia sp. TS-e1964]|nr:MAG: hypothetical protein M1829_000229 [Trizodia sp. TS-e1964]
MAYNQDVEYQAPPRPQFSQQSFSRPAQPAYGQNPRENVNRREINGYGEYNGNGYDHSANGSKNRHVNGPPVQQFHRPQAYNNQRDHGRLPQNYPPQNYGRREVNNPEANEINLPRQGPAFDPGRLARSQTTPVNAEAGIRQPHSGSRPGPPPASRSHEDPLVGGLNHLTIDRNARNGRPPTAGSEGRRHARGYSEGGSQIDGQPRQVAHEAPNGYENGERMRHAPPRLGFQGHPSEQSYRAQPQHYGEPQYRQNTERPPSTDFVSPGPMRSTTMPVNPVALGQATPPKPKYPGQGQWQDPGNTGGYYGAGRQDYIPRPATASGTRHAPPAWNAGQNPMPELPSVQRARSNEVPPLPANGYTSWSDRNQPHLQPPPGDRESMGDFLDSYYDDQNDGQPGSKAKRLSIEEDMPNFDAVHSDTAMPLHLEVGNVNINNPSAFESKVHKVRSQPDLRSHNDKRGAVFEMVADVPTVPPIPPNFSGPIPQQYSRGGPTPARNHLEPNRQMAHGFPPPNNQRGPGYRGPPPPQQGGGYPNPPHRNMGPQRNASSGTDRSYGSSANTGPSRPATANSQRQVNPDALPGHPTPVRPGLIPGSVANQAINGPLPRLQQNPQINPQPQNNPQNQSQSQPADNNRGSTERRASSTVTLVELEKLKEKVKSYPADHKTQLRLAEKLIEAASVLSDENGRADSKTKVRNRDKFISSALKILKKLISASHSEAMFFLADCYGRGLISGEPDPKEAFNLYQSAAKAGHPQAAYRTAVCCEMGHEDGGGTRKDPAKAVQWYKRAASYGDTPAMYKMGMILLKGLLGQPRNPREAVSWLKRAAEQADEENPHALHELGLLYETANGNDNIIRDEQYSKELFMQAANLGYKFSQFRLGCAYEYGLMGCPIDPRQSISWYSRSAAQEEHQSELALSGWYLTGSEGVLQQSDSEAYLWARKAAQAGLAKAEYAIGYFTEMGIGCPVNPEEAKRWYFRAAAQNFTKAKERLDELRKGGSKAPKSRERVSRSNVTKQNEGDCVLM